VIKIPELRPHRGKRTIMSKSGFDEEFHVVVVGAGSAGARQFHPCGTGRIGEHDDAVAEKGSDIIASALAH
jgi:hypothetical protein